jgi:prepilin-type N-terminal cleavage/methylation domain-containing protein
MQTRNKMSHFRIRMSSGFTLLEILLTIALLGILTGIVIFAINPAKQLSEGRNAQRRVDVNTILNAAHQYAIDNNGSYNSIIPTNSAGPIAKTGTSGNSLSGYVDLSPLTDSGKYLVSIPEDPSLDHPVNTGYSIVQDGNGRVTVYSDNEENNEDIQVTR